MIPEILGNGIGVSVMQQKLDYIVFLRVLCTVCVVLNHVPLVASHVFASQVSTENVFAATAIVHIVHFAVPVFVMITGALLLNPARQISFEKAVKKYAWRMVAVLLTVGYFFALMEQFSNTKTISVSLFSVSFMNVLTGNTWTHMWYLYMLVGLYLLIPFLKVVVDNTPKNIVPLIAVLFVFTSVLPMFKHFCDFQLGIGFPIVSCYVMYLLLGYCLSQNRIKSRIWPIAVFSGLSIFLVLCSYMEVWGGAEKMKFFESYASPVEVFIACGLFVFAVQRRFERLSELFVVKILDRNSFGIYVFHMLWLNVLYKVIKFNPFEYGLLMLVPVLLGVVGASVLTTEIFRRIPLIGKYI